MFFENLEVIATETLRHRINPLCFCGLCGNHFAEGKQKEILIRWERVQVARSAPTLHKKSGLGTGRRTKSKRMKTISSPG
jgi:hypothetical protein